MPLNSALYEPHAEMRADRYLITADQYTAYQRDGFLIVRQLVPRSDALRLRERSMAIHSGEVALPKKTKTAMDSLDRIHMLHRCDQVSEEFLLFPRVVDVVEALVGPDVLALQSMTFFNRPTTADSAGLHGGGQGWHQDSKYIATYPDTLIGTWLALDEIDEANGCLWVVPGSNHQPVYPEISAPDGTPNHANVHATGAIDIQAVTQTSHLDDEVNTLSSVARQYGQESWTACRVSIGDVIYFHPRLLHRSYPNTSMDRWRRAFVCHYCNARSWVPWNHGESWEGETANYKHILARGETHLAFAQPAFGTACAALQAVQAAKL